MPVTTTQAVIVRFKREEFFPSSDEFSVQLLRLMAATNDVRHLQKLGELDAKASVKRSGLMSTMHEIPDTAAQEFNNPNDHGLTIKRKAAYVRLQLFAEK